MGSILLIGGSSSVGKTHLARALGELLGLDQICVDDLKKNMHDPELHLFGREESTWDLPATELLARMFRQDTAVQPHLDRLVQSWIAAEKSMVLEGEGILPGFACRFRDTLTVKTLFVIETDTNRLYQTLYVRSAAFRKLTEPRRQRVAEMNSLYGQWLLSEADRYDLPWVESQPWTSLADRALHCIRQ